ncbi:hypothetical protein [Chitinophaga sp. GbtcB8]|uniref:hypothetical protein n=1 Tax=Chitinophaga sp. GbtcB8 TaxID=2824753 RepID=UPI001C308114|nr:hypothetical protein [Chitinophaga sp. GbtcB8]
MRDNSRTFESVTTSILKVLKEDFLRTKDLSLIGTGDKKLISSIRLLKHFLLTGEIIPRKAPVIFGGEIGQMMAQYVSYRKSERLSHHTIYNQELLLFRFLGNSSL